MERSHQRGSLGVRSATKGQGCVNLRGSGRSASLRDVELAQGELANALDSIDLQQMVGWLATQYQRLVAKVERDGQYA